MIGFIGAGNMGGALIGKLQDQEDLLVYSRNPERLKKFKVAVAEDEGTLCEKSDTIFLAVKPKDFTGLAEKIKHHLTSSKVVISIIAGLSLQTMQEELNKSGKAGTGEEKLKLVRVMPNTPSLIGAGAGGISFSQAVNEAERKSVVGMLRTTGYFLTIPEKKMDILTAISGCGPAYMFMILEALSDAGVRHGLSREEARELATQTMLGSAKLVLESGKHPMELKDQVTSPGGVTIEALSALEEEGLPHAIQAGVKAAYQKSIDMGKKLPNW